MSAPGPVDPREFEPAEGAVDWWWLATLILVAFMLGVGLTCLTVGLARAAEPPRWQLIECPPDQPCRPRGKPLREQTACDLDAASLALVVVKATRIKCERIGK